MSTIDTKLLRLLGQELVERGERYAFDMECFGEPECATPGCAAGVACTMPEFQSRGLRRAVDDDGSCPVFGDPEEEQEGVWAVLAALGQKIWSQKEEWWKRCESLFYLEPYGSVPLSERHDPAAVGRRILKFCDEYELAHEGK